MIVWLFSSLILVLVFYVYFWSHWSYRLELKLRKVFIGVHPMRLSKEMVESLGDASQEMYLEVMEAFTIRKVKVVRGLEDCFRLVSVILFCSILFVPPIFVDYPILIPSSAETTPATFAEDGQLVYHEWGLWAPPWKEDMVYVPKQTKLVTPELETRLIVQSNRWVYSLQFHPTLRLENPEKFYRRFPERRNRHSTAWEDIGKETGVALFEYWLDERELIEHILLSQCADRLEADGFDFKTGCPEIESFLEERFRVPLARDGIVMEIETNITFVHKKTVG